MTKSKKMSAVVLRRCGAKADNSPRSSAPRRRLPQLIPARNEAYEIGARTRTACRALAL